MPLQDDLDQYPGAMSPSITTSATTTLTGLHRRAEQGGQEHMEAAPGLRAGTTLSKATTTPSRRSFQSDAIHDSSRQRLQVRSSRTTTTTTRRQDRRQAAGAGVGNVSEGYPACNDVGNDRLSCFPEDDTVLQQGEYSKFIWNTNYPTYIGAGYVDIHLLNAGSEEELFAWRNVSTFRGSVGYQVDDAWLPTQTTWTEGQTITHSYYFVIATRGADINTGVRHQATFEVLQTAPPGTLASQLAAASSSSLAAVASSAAASTATSSETAAGATPTSFINGIPPAVATSIVFSGPTDLGSIPLTLTGDLSTITNLAGLTAVGASISSAQSSLSSVISSLSSIGSSIPPELLSSLSELSSSNNGLIATESSVVSSIARTRGPSVLQNNDPGNGDTVPKWTIALIAVLGFLALVAALVAIWFILRRMRRKRRESQYIEAKGLETSHHDDDSPTHPSTRDTSALGSTAALAGIPHDEKERPLSESFSDGTGNTGRMSSTSAAFPAGAGVGSARGGSAASGNMPATAAGVGVLAALASREQRGDNKRSDSPAQRTLERSYTDRTDSPHHFYDTLPSARFAGAAAAGHTGASGSSQGGVPGPGRGGVINKASSRSLGTNASTGAGTIAPYDAAIMADAYRDILRKPEFPHRNDDSSNSGEGNTPKDENGDSSSDDILAGAGARGEAAGERMPHTPKASGTTTPIAFGDSGSESGHHHHQGRERRDSSSNEVGDGRGGYGNRESDEEDGNEAHELIKHELANEGTSVKSNVERKRPEIRHD